MTTTVLEEPFSGAFPFSSHQSSRPTVRAEDCTNFHEKTGEHFMPKRPAFRHLVSTLVTSGRCRRCRRRTLNAIDSGIPARVDVKPLTQAEELTALLAGRWTYALQPSGALIHRDAEQIAAGTVGRSIHAEHRCPT